MCVWLDAFVVFSVVIHRTSLTVTMQFSFLIICIVFYLSGSWHAIYELWTCGWMDGWAACRWVDGWIVTGGYLKWRKGRVGWWMNKCIFLSLQLWTFKLDWLCWRFYHLLVGFVFQGLKVGRWILGPILVNNRSCEKMCSNFSSRFPALLERHPSLLYKLHILYLFSQINTFLSLRFSEVKFF